MLYTSVAFLFLMLPLSLAAFYLTPQKYRRWLLLLISAVFYILANLRNPLSIGILAAVSVLTYFAGKLAARTSFRYIGLVALLGYTALFIAFRFMHTYIEWFTFPLGSAVWLLGGASYIIDMSRKHASHARIDDALLYMMFFPVMIAGPVIKYKDFQKYISEAKYSINDFSVGVKMFSVGLIERMALATVLMESYELILETSNNAPNLAFGLFAILCLFLAVYFAFAGWADMGVGIARMFGIAIPRDFGGVLPSYSPAMYFGRIFMGLGSWLDDYVISPLMKFIHLSGKPVARAASGALTIIFISLWADFTLAVFIMALIAAAVSFVLSAAGADELMKSKKLLRPIGFFVTFFLVAGVWMAGVSGSVGSFFELLSSISIVANDYHIYYVYIVMSGSKYIISTVFALVFLPLTYHGDVILSKLPVKMRPVTEAVSVIALLALFVATIIYCLPQYPRYAVQAFKYFVF